MNMIFFHMQTYRNRFHMIHHGCVSDPFQNPIILYELISKKEEFPSLLMQRNRFRLLRDLKAQFLQLDKLSEYNLQQLDCLIERIEIDFVEKEMPVL